MRSGYALIFLIVSFFPKITFSQSTEEQTSFSSRMINPVTIAVKNSSKDITFTAENSSWYPYHITIQFTSFVNLTPMMNNYKTDIYHGKTVLFVLNVTDIGAYHDYTYNLQYSIGYSNKKAALTYPYPIPLPDGKAIKLSQSISNRDTTFSRNVFMLNSGDTVLCMRKGIVTNILSSGEKYDRILKSGNVEIIHTDGTVATYSIPDEDNILVVPGQQVYPLQPLMILRNPGALTIQMFEINDTATRSINFEFENENSKEGNLNGKIVRHFLADIEMELNNKEKKKFAAGDLFKR